MHMHTHTHAHTHKLKSHIDNELQKINVRTINPHILSAHTLIHDRTHIIYTHKEIKPHNYLIKG